IMTNTCHQAIILKVFLQHLLSLFICSNKRILASIIHTGNNLQATDDLASCSIPRLMLFHLIPLAFLQPRAHLLQLTLPLFSIAAWHFDGERQCHLRLLRAWQLLTSESCTLIIIPYLLELEVGIKGNNAINLKTRSSSSRPSKATRTSRVKIITWKIRSCKVWWVMSIAVLASINGGEFVKCWSYSCCSSPSCCFIKRCRRMDSICHPGHFSLYQSNQHLIVNESLNEYPWHLS